MTKPAAITTARASAVLDEIEHVVVGKRSALTLILTTVLAGGHVLIEDLPGLGKTLIARSFAATLGLDFTRVQFTPDLLPADLLGSTIYDMQSGHFEFRPRPKRRCWKRWPKARSASMASHTGCPNRSLSWLPTTPSNTKAPIRCPRHSWTGSRFGSKRATSL